ncbi:MAG: S24/S26 family peptidase [Gammaproteobacteria bacterium]|jgi:DNA-binding transcriptional regulator YiaG
MDKSKDKVAQRIAQDKQASAKENRKARAGRLRRIRSLANMERPEFVKRYGVNWNTYKDWEIAKRNSIPKKRAYELAEKLKVDGIIVDAEWLLFGIGNEPYRVAADRIKMLEQNTESFDTALNEEKQIEEELAVFMSGNHNTISFEVSDETMLPFYAKGDIVAGIKYAEEDFEKLIGKICIVQIANNQLFLRKLQNGKKKRQYTLLIINPNFSDENNIYNTEIISAAPVLWSRRRQSLF